MNKSTTAALISALVFPGAGHLYLRKYIPGVVLAGISGICFYVLASNVMDRAQNILNEVQQGKIQPDITTVTALVSEQSASADSTQMTVSSYLLITCWILGIIGAYKAAPLSASAPQNPGDNTMKNGSPDS